MFFNKCRLSNVSLIHLEIKHFEQVASCLNQWKKGTVSEISFNYTPRRSVSLLTSGNGQSYFSNCNNKRMTFAHTGILLFFMQRIDECLVALKDFDYSCSLGYINGQLRQKGK